MSEPKRVVPQCLEFPDSLGHATKKETKKEKGKQLAPSFRFTIALPESNDKAYSEFNYAQLVKSAEKKRRKEEQRTSDENATNGLDLFTDVDADDDKLREIASRFEAKYGTATAAKKRHKYDDYVDLGAGYDENDSFIDNTDAYDEIVPGEVTTAYGGFYINSGPLEFKPADGSSPVHSRLININNNNNNNEDEEEDESSEGSAEDEEDVGNRVLRRMEKRILSSSDEDDDDDIIPGEPPRKKHKTEENGGDKKSNSESVTKRKRKLQGESCNPSNQHCEDMDGTTNAGKNFNDEKREILDLECSSEDQEERKRAKYDLIKTKPTTGDKKYDVNKKLEKKLDMKRCEKKQQQPPPPPLPPPAPPPPPPPPPASNGLDVKKIDMKKLAGKDSNIDDAIESVVNAGRAEDESSRDTIDSGKSVCPVGTDSECDDVEKEDTPLPEQLPDNVKDIINKLKAYAEKSRESKGKIFDDNFNSTLLALEEKLRMMNLAGVRLLTYGHLATFLRCNKATLINRAKKLCLQDTDRRIKEPLHRLKMILEGMMPGVVDRYAKECQRAAEEKGFEGSPAEVDSSDAENCEKSKIPRKKFPWTTEIKKLIYEIACARRHYFKIRKPRKESIETFVATYMESKILPLWPGGWVRLQTLLKYSNPEPAEKRKQKKFRDSTAVPNSLSASAISSTVARQELSNVSIINIGTMNQERAITPTNLAKITTENSLNFTTIGHGLKFNETQQTDRKMSVKVREKNSSSPMRQENNVTSCNRDAMAKITVVPTCQLIGHGKSVKSITEKFNPMDLTSSSLSITPVNDYPKTYKSSSSEVKKDVVSITPYSETTAMATTTTTTTMATATATMATATATATTTTMTTIATATITSGNVINDLIMTNVATKNCPGKQQQQRIQESSISDTKSEKRIDERSDTTDSCQKNEKRDKRRDRWHETKKRRKEQNPQQTTATITTMTATAEATTMTTTAPTIASATAATATTTTTTTTTAMTTMKKEISTNQQSCLLTKEEQEQRRQIEETTAATNFLSQIINDDLPTRGINDKRKEQQTIIVDENIAGVVVQQTSEQDNDVQMVMRSLKEIQELQEMKYSPSHSPVGSQQKSTKSSHRYIGYQDDYPRIYNKKDEKIRVTKEETSSW